MSPNTPFSPLYNVEKSNEFNRWDLKKKEPEPAKPDEAEEAARKLAEECAQIKEQAKQEGFAQGLEEARESMQRYEQELKQIQKTKSQLLILYFSKLKLFQNLETD